jgi:predicted aconitase with swiveling domain
MKGRIISPGCVEGEAIVSNEPIGFYGGVDAKTGIVIDRGHELEGKSVTDKILIFPCGKGSTVGSYVIYGLKKNGVAPRAIVNEETETIVATGVILAGIPCVDKIDLKQLNVKSGDRVRVDADSGSVETI